MMNRILIKEQDKSVKAPLVSVITVVFNGKSILEKTLQSIMSQTYSNIEYIVVDGGSSDGTLDTLLEYDDVIDCWISEKDSGIYDAMNKAIDMASGDWIIFMNADDVFYSNDVIKDIFEDHQIEKNIDIIYGDTEFDYFDFTRIAKARPLKYIDKGMVFTHQSCFIRAEYHKKNKYLLNYPISADFDFCYKAYKKNIKFQYFDKVISKMVVGGLSDTNRFDTLRQNHRIVNQVEWSFKNNIYFLMSYFDLLLRNVVKLLLPRTAVIYLTKLKSKGNN